MKNNNRQKIARVVAFVIALIMIVSSVLMGLPMVYGASGTRVYGASKDVVDEKTLDQELDFMAQLIKSLRDVYKDEVSYETLVSGAYEGIFDALNDPYSEYMENEEEVQEFEESVSGEFEGVGITMENDNGRCKVVSPVMNSPADRAGIKSGDYITAVDGVSLDGMTLNQWRDMMRGPAGTEVTLTVERKGIGAITSGSGSAPGGTAVLTFTLVRETIRTESVSWEMLEDNIAYVQIFQFDSDSHRELRWALAGMEHVGAEAMILDVRNNPGGYVNVAVNVANMLIPGEDKDIMVMTRQGESLGTIMTSGAGDGFELPLVLLINEGSASSSEILAGALQDNDAATLVGTTTYGKGIAQMVTELENGGTMKVSTYYFTTPDGRQIHGEGVSPDVYVVNGVNAMNGAGSGLSAEALAAEYARLAPMTEKVKYTKGQMGLNVYAAQQRLNLLGYDLALTAVMDDETFAAVKKFQKDAGMFSYGRLDYGTMETLERYVAQLFVTDGRDYQLEKAVEILKAR